MGPYVAGANYLKTGLVVGACFTYSVTGQGPSGFLSVDHLKDCIHWNTVDFTYTWNRTNGTITCNNTAYPCNYVIVFGT